MTLAAIMKSAETRLHPVPAWILVWAATAIFFAAAASAQTPVASTSLGQAYPVKPVRFIVPFPAAEAARWARAIKAAGIPQ